MEDQNPQDLNPNPSSSNVGPASPDVISAKAGIQFPLLLIILLSIIAILGAGIYLGSSGKNFFSRDAGISAVPTSIVSAPTVQPTVAPTSEPSPTIATINWDLFSGETIYTTDGSSKFTIEYPGNWLLEGRNLFPNGKDGATLILGAGGHGLCEGCTQEEMSQQYSFGEKQYTAGTAKTISNKVINETGNFVLASFEKGNVTYIFEFRNIPKANLDEYKATFEKMLTTFKFL